MTVLRALYELFPPRARERIKLILNAHGHGQSRLDGVKARDHARGKKRLDRVAETLTGVLAKAGISSLRDAACLEFGAGYVPTEAVVFYLLGANRSVATDYNPIAHLDHLVTAARSADPGRVLALLSPYADGIDLEQRLNTLVNADTPSARRIIANEVTYIAPHDMSAAALSPRFDVIHSVSVFEHLPVALAVPILANLVRSLKPGGKMITEIDLRDHRDLDGAPLAFLSPEDDYDPAIDHDRRGNRLRCSEWLAVFERQSAITTRQLYVREMEKRFLPPVMSGTCTDEEIRDVLISWVGLLSVHESTEAS